MGMKEQDDLAHRKVYVAQKGLVPGDELKWVKLCTDDDLVTVASLKNWTTKLVLSNPFYRNCSTMDYDFLILMELIVVSLCHLKLYTQLTFILRESMPAVLNLGRTLSVSPVALIFSNILFGSGTNTEENVYENHVTQALKRI
ncbi:hypothetical protein C5167_001898 [Papaver somniferum]|uniref:Uncharacterized protein n=1 Tax=Papaver somniferum TaxID=3469 RepID=A0A4Y7KWJ9_PAPSO|nr:hypothetical protein C5167_001898 [Papaver somniferum]